ncbi:MAG: hypothetical protein UR25_C0003G0183 [Candidatus Nomurabacteria bacterium GW2011_GWE1_32_28]|uniref:site-specific DNA-methyltransferase (adenine-specific) n=1 Tax=Candidatus Nomurabacteria bacterium GW2011_GWF1_31_48 TaxID=1618767 RepID=A0A0G0AUQ8_9BACT|nr:MAG: hypothetical protein UR10_C0003G0182 [Candidatus Nomurabacteria bacterium GW2011_GWF2_30_133]KKP28822.1 MAG: hypothetical protein UR18_C0002G0234 [Candidatus Nomurabacteria bacterium GW2011_GWE2_31_40]KKP30400.1 MAG: hypothetical protein UR19_C0003G0236 [Candidatus Nomurabacteria bacterium GW2011_GWF1_31_48]KKP34927.1 MAG: hypothetical protein UR25_C0003G0183 [Candidatus Nomurabacteria bacterium GW2011_GWE1_32_28]HAS81018.1 hypothetical protein [Candidatus Nomurabacteria bacterium]
MDKELVKQNVQKLVEKYEIVKRDGKLRTYSEEDTIQGFVLPLLEILGWNIRDKNEVSSQDHIKGSGRPDHTLKINGITQFYLESKKLSVDLDDEIFSKQVINYSWNTGVTYAILTDFESIKVFNAQRIDKTDLMDKLVFELSYNKYVSDFEILWLLSKESFQKKTLDEYAEKIGKKEKSVQVSTVIKKINEDIQDCREWLTNEFKTWNEKLNLSKDMIDEGVQKLLDRLIFLRVAEDREVEPNILKNLLREAEKSKSYKPFQAMSIIFRELDKIYNSNLFSPHPFESWEIVDDKGFEKMIEKLYGKKGQYEYNFKEMPADVLGTVYENYLNYKLTQSKKGVNVEKDVKKRKEQGIFYTPTFVVDYIVRNALKPVLDNCKSVADLKKIKVLDPACGSGSFLIRALEAITEKYKEFGIDGSVKRQIILENLFGVDLDMQAVEIARLNLLINSLDLKEILPKLNNNIKNGNSLISGTDEEMEKQFGKNWKDKKPFNWQEEFPDVFKQGGFDVIIGNPPYVRQEEIKEDKEIFSQLFPNVANGTADLYVYFFERAIQLLKNSGYLGFIISNKFIKAGYGKNLRKYLKESLSIKQLIDQFNKKVFEDAVVDPCTIIIKKEKPLKNSHILYNYETNILQANLNESGWTFANEESLDLKSKIEEKGKKIKDWEGVNIRRGIVTGLNEAFILNLDNKERFIEEDKNCDVLIKPLLAGRNIKRYLAGFDNKFLLKIIQGSNIDDCEPIKNHLLKFKDELSERWEPKNGKIKWFELRSCVYYEEFEKPKIIYPDISDTGGFYWDDEGYFLNNTIYMITGNIKKSWVGLLNSRLISWYYKKIASGLGEGGVRYFTQFVKELPIPENTESLDNLTQKMLDLNKELKKILENSNEWENIKSEIEKTDKKINEEVYGLYGLNEKEIKIIEK